MRKFKVEKDILQSLYVVTSNGIVLRKSDGYQYSPSLDHKGYLRLRLPYPKAHSKDGRYPFKVHRLVAMFYLVDYSENLQVNHKNGIKTDNRVENLEMATNRENALHAWRVLDSKKRRKLMSDIMKNKYLKNYGKADKIGCLQLRLF